MVYFCFSIGPSVHSFGLFFFLVFLHFVGVVFDVFVVLVVGPVFLDSLLFWIISFVVAIPGMVEL